MCHKHMWIDQYDNVFLWNKEDKEIDFYLLFLSQGKWHLPLHSKRFSLGTSLNKIRQYKKMHCPSDQSRWSQSVAYKGRVFLLLGLVVQHPGFPNSHQLHAFPISRKMLLRHLERHFSMIAFLWVTKPLSIGLYLSTRIGSRFHILLLNILNRRRLRLEH